MEQFNLSALLRKSRSAAKAAALPALLAVGASASATLLAPQAASAVTANYNCTFPANGATDCVPWQHGDKLVAFRGFEIDIDPSLFADVSVNYSWRDADGPLDTDYSDDRWRIAVNAIPGESFVGPFTLAYSYSVDIIDGPGIDSNGIAFDGRGWVFDEFGIGQDAIGDRTTTFKTVDPTTGADIVLDCDTTDDGTTCDGLTSLLSSVKSVTITDVVTVTGTSELTSVSNSWTQKRTEVPGPLPILGAGVAFGYSRKLRKRITSAKAV